jgi:hypothetical protein
MNKSALSLNSIYHLYSQEDEGTLVKENYQLTPLPAFKIFYIIEDKEFFDLCQIILFVHYYPIVTYFFPLKKGVYESE